MTWRSEQRKLAGKRLFQGQFSVEYVTLMILRWGKSGGHIRRPGGKRRESGNCPGEKGGGRIWVQVVARDCGRRDM